MLRYKRGAKLYFRVYFHHHIHCKHFKHLLVVWLWPYVANLACLISFQVLKDHVFLRASDYTNVSDNVSLLCYCLLPYPFNLAKVHEAYNSN